MTLHVIDFWDKNADLITLSTRNHQKQKKANKYSNMMSSLEVCSHKRGCRLVWIASLYLHMNTVPLSAVLFKSTKLFPDFFHNVYNYACMCYSPGKQTLFVCALTQTTRSACVHYQAAHLCRHGPGTAMRSWAPWCGPAFNKVLSWAQRSHGPLSTLLWVGPCRFEALCKNCTNTNVLEEDGICVYASIQLDPCP